MRTVAKAAATLPITYGVADDTGKYADDGGAWFNTQLKGAHLTQERWTLSFNPTTPTAITELPFLQRAAPRAQADGIHVVLALYGRPATATDPNAFCAWAATVATTVKAWGIHDFIVWNEPNTALYWSPQDDSAPAKYEALLAKCYDTIHAADSQARVIGFGLSPRTNGATQTGPLVFIAGVGTAYKSSGRTTPIMDQMSIHPYPNPNNPTDGPDVGYVATGNYGVPNLDRVKQALYDAFNGTGQATTVNGLTFRIDELGWQTNTTAYSQYIRTENVNVVSEQTQADFVKLTVQKYFACDPTVTDVEWFLLVDEPTRDGRDASGNVLGGGWQSGLLTAGGSGVSTPKLAYAQDGPLFGQGRSACTGSQITWTPLGGSTDTTGGAGVGGLSGSAGDPTSFFPADALTRLQAFMKDFASDQAQLTALVANLRLQAGSLYQFSLAQFLPFLTFPQPTFIDLSVFFCGVAGQCNGTSIANLALGRATSSRAAARPTVVASATTKVKAGARPKFVIKNAKKKVKLKAGSYALALVMRNAADRTKKYAVAIRLRSVVQKAVVKPKAKPKKK